METEDVAHLDPKEQRKLAVAKLKIAASLPRLKGGRRPQMVQPEAISVREKVEDNKDQTLDIDTPPESIESQVEIDAHILEPSTKETEVSAVRPPYTDSLTKYDTTVPTYLARSSIPSHRLSSPPPPSPPPLLPPPPLPPLPPLDQWNRPHLRRLHNTIRRQTAIHTLTGDVYDLPLSPAATPPPLRTNPRNLTVTGDDNLGVERPLKHKQRLNALIPRLSTEADSDAEANSVKDCSAATTKSLRTPLMPLLLTPPPTPSPQTQHHPDVLPRVRARFMAPMPFPSTSASPTRMRSSSLLTLEDRSTENDWPAPMKWRGVVVEEDDDSDDRSEILFRYPGLPPHLPERTPSKRVTFPGGFHLTPSKDRALEDDEEDILYPTDISRLRSPSDRHGREVSWIAPSKIHSLIHDDDTDRGKDDGLSIEDRAPSSTSVYLRQDAYGSSPCTRSNSQHNIAIDEAHSDANSSQTPPSLPPAIFCTSLECTSDDPVSSQSLPSQPLAVMSPTQGDPKPLGTNFMDLDGCTAGTDTSKRSRGDTSSTNTLGETTNVVSSRYSSHSQNNSFGPQEGLDYTDLSINHECGAILDIGRTDKRYWSPPVVRQSEIMESSSAPVSVSTLTPTSVSSGPLTSGVDCSSWCQNLMSPLVEEERRLKGGIGGSSFPSDISILDSREEGDQVPMSAKSLKLLPGVEPSVEHKIEHQTSDTNMRYQLLNSPATLSSSSQQDGFSISSAGSSSSKLWTVSAWRWLIAPKTKFLSPSSPPEDGAGNIPHPTADNEIIDHHEEPFDNTGTGDTLTVPASLPDVSKDEAIVEALLDASRESGPWHIIDSTTDELARKVATVLSNCEIYDQLSDLPIIQAQSTLDFLQNLLDIRGLPLSYKRTFLKASLKLARLHDCVPRCLTIGGFRKTGKHPFARGHFGDLWRGEVEGTEVAVKQGRIFTKENNGKKVLRKMTREAIIWGQCDHPNVLPFYGMYRDSTPSLCLVSPFMVNGPLRQYLSNADNPDRRRLALDITRGMNYLHKLLIVHGDLKGDNILITDDRRAVIADFGLSFVMGVMIFGTSSSSRKGGTVRWQPPEVINGNMNSLSADVYSLACVYFEVFDGTIPWSDLNDGAVILNVSVQKQHPPCPKHLATSDLWWEIMVQCWAYEPSHRPTLQNLMERLHMRGDTLPPPPQWDKPDLARLRGPLVQGKLNIPSDLPSFLKGFLHD